MLLAGREEVNRVGQRVAIADCLIGIAFFTRLRVWKCRFLLIDPRRGDPYDWPGWHMGGGMIAPPLARIGGRGESAKWWMTRARRWKVEAGQGGAVMKVGARRKSGKPGRIQRTEEPVAATRACTKIR